MQSPKSIDFTLRSSRKELEINYTAAGQILSQKVTLVEDALDIDIQRAGEFCFH